MTHAGLTPTTLWWMLLLGAYHGINPGMGWLFAVALGIQEQKGSAVAKSIIPLAVGHALAIAIVVLATALLGMVVPLTSVRYCVAAFLIGLGIWSLVKHWHLQRARRGKCVNNRPQRSPAICAPPHEQCRQRRGYSR